MSNVFYENARSRKRLSVRVWRGASHIEELSKKLSDRHLGAGSDGMIYIDGQAVVITPVSVGNPHAVIFVEDIEAAPLTTLGPSLRGMRHFSTM